MLEQDLEHKDYPVISGMMNVEKDDFNFLNLCEKLPIKNRKMRKYVWIRRADVNWKDLIFQVAFSGFPLMAIRRDVVEKVPFDADRVFEGKTPDRGASLDLVFCWYCNEKDIPIMVDRRIDLIHLRTKGRLMINKFPTKILFQKSGSEQIEYKL